MQILVVDDNQDLCEMMETVLLLEGYDVVALTNPLLVHDVVNEKHPQLIVSDMLMSGVDGRVLCKNLKTDEKTRNIKIMMVSAHPDAEIRSREAGADDFLPKPFGIDEFVGKVKSLME